MKRKLITWGTVLIVLAVTLYTATAIYAALTKTTAIVEVDAWQAVTAGTLVVGTAADVSASYETILYLESAHIEAVASDGPEYIIEGSYASTGNWVQVTTVKGTAETPATTTTVGAAADSNTVVDLTDSATGDFDVVGRKWFIKDGTIGNSESVRTKSNSANAVTLCIDLLRAHDSGVNVYDRVDEWVIKIPFGFSQVRVLANNVDADCDVAFTTRLSKVTAIQ